MLLYMKSRDADAVPSCRMDVWMEECMNELAYGNPTCEKERRALGRGLIQVVEVMVRFSLGQFPKVWGTPGNCRVSLVGTRDKALKKVFFLIRSSLGPDCS